MKKQKQKKLKILIATGIYPPDIGGPATYSKLLFDNLPKQGIDVEILSFGEVRHLPKIIRHFVYFFKVLKKGMKVDVIYAQDPVSVGLPLMLANKILRKRFLIRIAGDYAWEQGVQRFGVKDLLDDFQNKKYSWQVELMRFIQRQVAKSAEKIITPSKYLKSIIKKWGIKEDEIEVIYNAVDFRKPEPKIKSADEKWIVSVGRLVPWKGMRALIDIMPQLLELDNNLKLIIIGDGPERKEYELVISKLEATDHKHNLQNKIKLLGKLDHDETLSYVGSADLFILNSGYEGLPHVVIEAMSLRTPVIVSNAGGNVELVENKITGLVVGYNNKEQIRSAIINILQSRHLREKLVKNASSELEKFKKEEMLEKIIKTLS